MPSPYNSLVRTLLRLMEDGKLDAASLAPLLSDDSVLHAPSGAPDEGAELTRTYTGAEGFAAYFAELSARSDGTLALKPQSFELRDRGAVSLVHASGKDADGVEYTQSLRVVLGMEGGRVKEMWVDPGDRDAYFRQLALR